MGKFSRSGCKAAVTAAAALSMSLPTLTRDAKI